MSDPAGRHVVISGGSRGLGEAIVRSLLSAGYRVSTFSRSTSLFIEEMKQRPDFFFSPADLADMPSVASFLKESEKHFGTAHALINCAAIAADGLLATLAENAIQKMLAVNVDGTLRFTRLVVRRMLSARKGGVIRLAGSDGSRLAWWRGQKCRVHCRARPGLYRRSIE